jgi:hypothetical protein
MATRKTPEAQLVVSEAVNYITDIVMVDKRMSPAARDLPNAAMYERGDFTKGAMSVVLREDYIPHLSEPEDSRNQNTVYRASQIPINGEGFATGPSTLTDWDHERGSNYAPCQSSADSNGMVQSLTFVTPADETVPVPRQVKITPTSCRTQTSSSGKRSLSEMYNVSPTAEIDSETHMPKIRNWETHLELDTPPDVVDMVDHDISPEVNSARLFNFYQSIETPSSGNGSSSSDMSYPDPD